MSTRCPSYDADRYFNEQCEAAEAEALFFRNHREEILRVVCALIAGGFNVFSEGTVNWHGKPVVQGDVIKHAGEIVRLLNESGEME